ncbi:MAG: hypothetical protein OEX14_09780 [Paracoccaceae bacterium]|nr:hypothetical protein [Paracoccaceae bacterium]
MMKEFILDKNVDLEPTQKEYPKYFFDALRQSSRIRLVIGGTDYRREIKEKTSLLQLISDMITSGKVRSVDDSLVDERQKKLIDRILETMDGCPTECDDHHIFALSVVSGCCNVITKETRMATCRDKIRNVVGHDHCPNIRVVRNQSSYEATP